jgi:hypothetical protein
VSEYQYYEFRTIDRPLTEAEMDALGSISTRAEITSTSFTNHYEWGDLKADPIKLLERFFDAFVYVSNWGTRRFWLRLPKAWIDYDQIERTLPGYTASVHRSRQHLIIGFDVNELESDDLDDGTGWMAALVSLRSDLLRGDLRCLYLGWLLSAQIGELDEGQTEPPAPAGLGQLTASLKSLIDFLCIDEDLVAAAATSAPLKTGPSEQELKTWICNLSENEKTRLLVTATLDPGERWKNELLHRFYRDNQPLTSTPAAGQPRTVGDLLSAAEGIANERAQKLATKRAAEAARRKAEEEANRARYLDLLAKREEATWNQVTELIQKRQPKAYDQAVWLLIDLRDLAVRQQLEPAFGTKIDKLRETHKAKGSFLDRLSATGI